ncbi:MAG: transglutaminase domain-containing protein [Desulfobacteraceae bacterium]|nr:transglutaminase domain-containing protein [Desulfobacteraceae bacterium]
MHDAPSEIKDVNACRIPTETIDSDHPRVAGYARKVIGDDPASHRQMAIALYYAVRDGIRYDPYYPFYLAGHYRASNIIKSGRGYCVSKAVLLCALARAVGIPARLGFADVRNHIATRQLLDFIGTNLFVYHGYTQFYLEDKWVSATPAFNLSLCRLHKVDPLDFDGRSDSLFQPYNNQRKRFMEYVRYHGHFPDLPLEAILEAWRSAYGNDRVAGWIRASEQSGGNTSRNFYGEDVISD